MKIGVFSVVLSSMKLEQALDYLHGFGVQALEIGVGGYPGSGHCPVDELLASGRKAKEFTRLFSSLFAGDYSGVKNHWFGDFTSWCEILPLPAAYFSSTLVFYVERAQTVSVSLDRSQMAANLGAAGDFSRLESR